MTDCISREKLIKALEREQERRPYLPTGMGFHGGIAAGLQLALLVAREQISVPVGLGGWTSVNERIPYEACECIVTIGEVIVMAAYWNGYEWRTVEEHLKIPNVTHWMPLPTPPENGGGV